MRWTRLILRNLRQRPGRTIVCVTSVTIGVAVFLSVSIGTRDLSESIVPRGTRALLQGSLTLTPAGVFDAVAPRSAVDQIRALADVDFAEGIQVTSGSIERNGEFVPITLSASPTIPPLEGRAPTPGAAEIIVGLGLAEIDDVVRVWTPNGLAGEARVTGVVVNGSQYGWLAMTTVETMQAWTGSGDVVNNVVVRLADGVDPDAWVDAHRAELSPFQETTGFLTSDAVEFFRSIDEGLAPLAASSLFVSGYLIFLTMGRAIQDRRTSLATLRALGTSRVQLVGLILGEAALIGIIGTITGYALGTVLGRVVTGVLRGMFGITISGADATPSIPTSVTLVAIALGLLTPLIASALPALLAARSDPAAHLRGEVQRDLPTSMPRLVGGAAAFALGTVLIVLVATPVKAGAALLALAGAAVALPTAARPAGALLARVWSRLRPGPGELAAQEMARRPGRSAQTTALVATILMMTVIIATINASQRPEFLRIVDAHYGATANVYATSGFGVTDEMRAALAADPAVAAVSPGATGIVTMLDSERAEPLRVIDPDTYFTVAGIPWARGTDSDEAVAGLRRGEVVLASAVAARIGADVGVGDRVRIQTLSGPVSFRVAGLFYGLSWGESVSVTVSTDVARTAFGLRATPFLRVDLRPGIDVHAWAASNKWGFVRPTSEVRASILEGFDGITNIAFALLIVTVFVGIMGLANTLAMDMLDRQREVGVLRALGLQRREVRSMVLSHAFVLTAVAGGLAVLLGSILGAAFVAGSQSSSLSMPMSFAFPTRAVPLILMVSLVVGALAGLTPARIASRMEPTDALRLPVEA